MLKFLIRNFPTTMTLIQDIKALQEYRERKEVQELLRMRRDNTASFLREEFPKETDRLLNLMEQYSNLFPKLSEALLEAVALIQETKDVIDSDNRDLDELKLEDFLTKYNDE